MVTCHACDSAEHTAGLKTRIRAREGGGGGKQWLHLGEFTETVERIDVGAADALVVEPHQGLIVQLDAQDCGARWLG